jgi:hypothetical protein
VEVSVGDLSDYWPTLRLQKMYSPARIAVDKYETAVRPFSALRRPTTVSGRTGG